MTQGFESFLDTVQINISIFLLINQVFLISSKKHKVGATRQNRTADLRVTNPLLYQLSYSGMTLINISHY